MIVVETCFGIFLEVSGTHIIPGISLKVNFQGARTVVGETCFWTAQESENRA